MCKSSVLLNSIIHITLVSIGCKVINLYTLNLDRKQEIYCKQEIERKQQEHNNNKYSIAEYSKPLGPF